MEYDSRANERQIQTTEEKIDTSNALDELDASSVIIESNVTESQKQDTSSRSGNDADIRPIYDEEPMAEVQMTADDNVSATGQQHTEQPESNNEGEVDQNVDQCYDTHPLPAKLTDNTTTELLNQLLEFENICLKKTVAQFQKDFSRMEAHCVNLELKYQNQALKEGQHGQFSKVKSNEAKVNNDIDGIKTIKIELKHSVAKLLVENELLHKEKEHLKQTYKDLFDSIKTTQVQTKDQNDSLMAQLNKKSNENVDAPFLNVQLTFKQRSSSLVLHQMTSDHNRSELRIQDHSNEPSSSKLVPKVVPLAVKTATSRQELELL
ncbi:hypothetical protein Tco_1504057 [Tanacetum coccineum]